MKNYKFGLWATLIMIGAYALFLALMTFAPNAMSRPIGAGPWTGLYLIGLGLIPLIVILVFVFAVTSHWRDKAGE